ncbi:hypothetical protein VM1G_11313 [Cytospora mali]|uniref:Uncharacterized protein n=1 Tax=Cytospora mali TaxID=578113 RepID=A0A194VPB1_CYTMA|nr:hypothetical protein VM1G_11313 [Valsa mali]
MLLKGSGSYGGARGNKAAPTIKGRARARAKSFPKEYFTLNRSPDILPAVPDLKIYPEFADEATKKAIITTRSLAWKYNLLMNYGYLPMYEIYNRKGERLLLDW